MLMHRIFLVINNYSLSPNLLRFPYVAGVHLSGFFCFVFVVPSAQGATFFKTQLNTHLVLKIKSQTYLLESDEVR